MSSSDIAISVRGLAKSYTIAHNSAKHVTLAESLLHRARHPFQRSQKETFWALNDVSFDIKKGDVVGIIGRNGAGKSTLLKILSRITEPTKGEIDLYGRVGSLLEVGTGFHPELTGRENIYLNGAILGMSKAEIRKQFDAIVDFAGVEKFLDTPVKRYSSGMYVRLAFAVAAHLESEILIVDEVLAVGDAEFQKKCLRKIRDVASGGRTAVFVSHHMQSISSLCGSALFLEDGTIFPVRTVQEAIDRYFNPARLDRITDEPKRRLGSGELRMTTVRAGKSSYLTTESITLELDVVRYARFNLPFFVSLHVINEHGLSILHMDSRLLNKEFLPTDEQTIRYIISCPRLAIGRYTVKAYLCTGGGILDQYENAAELSILPILPYPSTRGDCVGGAIVYPEFDIQNDFARDALER